MACNCRFDFQYCDECCPPNDGWLSDLFDDIEKEEPKVMDDWTQLINGGRFNLGRLESHNLRGLTRVDIAKSLSQITRFRGATRFPVNVAQHSVLVSRLAEHMGGTLAGLYGLLHDVHELVVSDIPSPIKRLFKERCPGFGEVLRELEDDADRTLWPVCGAAWPMPNHVKEFVKIADLMALATEYRDACEHVDPWANPYPPASKFTVEYQEPNLSALIFVARLQQLLGRLEFENASVELFELRKFSAEV